MKFDEVNNNTEPRKEYPQVKLVGKLEKVIKKGTTEKGSWIVLGFKELKGSAIFFAKSKEEVDGKLENIDIGSSVQIELSGSSKGNVLKNIVRAEEVEGENPSTSHRHLSDEDLSAFLPAFICQNCGEQSLMFKQELREEIEKRIKDGILRTRYPHVQEN
jgi:hypothetical protein